MTSMCEKTRRDLALGLDDSAEPHLRKCEACRGEAARVRQLVRAVAESAEVGPPAALDARVRRDLAVSPLGAPPLPSPVAASGLAIAAWTCVFFGVGIWLASTGLAEAAPAVTATIAVCYLAVCATASLPLLVRRARLRPAGLREVRS